MPKLDTTLHLDMFVAGKRRRNLIARIRKAIKVLLSRNDVYGLEWGDPDVIPPLTYVRDHFLTPYLTSNAIVAEIGPGGGRWTRYMLNVKQIYAVDYHQELLDDLKSNFGATNITYVKNNGDDFPDMQERSIDLLFSFGTFVHLDIDIIDCYLRNMKPLLKPTSNVVIQYSDKTKPLGRSNKGFSDNDPIRMRKLILLHGYSIYEEDVTSIWHSSIVRFGLPNTRT